MSKSETGIEADIDALKAELEGPLKAIAVVFFDRPNSGGPQRFMSLMQLGLRSHLRGEIDLTAHTPEKILDALEAAVQAAHDKRISLSCLFVDAGSAQTMPYTAGVFIADEQIPGSHCPEPPSPGLS